MAKENETIKVLSSVINAIERGGVDAVLNNLYEIDDQNWPEVYQSRVATYICKKATIAYGVDMIQMKSKNTRGMANTARMTCFILLEKHLAWSQQRIINCCGGSSRSIVSMAKRDYQNMSEKIPRHRKFMQTLDEIDESVKRFKSSLPDV